MQTDIGFGSVLSNFMLKNYKNKDSIEGKIICQLYNFFLTISWAVLKW